MDLDAATFFLQWATGGLAFLWITTRRREVGLGYGWLLRGTYGLFALLAGVIGVWAVPTVVVREVASFGVAAAALVALVSSVQRRRAGVVGQKAVAEERTARVAAMTGIDRRAAAKDADGPEFDPRLDLIAPCIGVVGVVAAGVTLGDPAWLWVLRLVAGAALMGAVSDAMLLGHWYLVQPGLARGPLVELVRWCGWTWAPATLSWLIPTGMVAVLTGTIDDGWSGLLGWFWLACAVTTGGLVVVTRLALRERQYSAVMAATGLLYLAILTAFGIDLVARALLV
ncbi:MAG: hypothetical protein JJU45_18355 [Acidimicrobiia bacterium]|nr:hypothetical protein [Acidimicrobiia bacterium]